MSHTSLRHIWIALALVAPSAAAQVTFTEVASQVGLDFTALPGTVFPEITSNAPLQLYFGYGAAVGDYDDDGDLDAYLLSGRGHANKLYRNELSAGLDQFTDVTGAAGAFLADLGGARVAHFADLDADGDLDLVLVNDQAASGQYPGSRVFSNNGDGTFADVSGTSGFEPVGYGLCGASLADYDQDGLLDIYVSAWVNDLGSTNDIFNWVGHKHLYKNLGNFQFVEVTQQVGLVEFDASMTLGPVRVDSFTSIFTDFTGNGYPDIFVAVDHSRDRFYVNDGGVFVEQSIAVGLNHTGNDMGVTCADIDNDRDLDLYVTNITDIFQSCGYGTTQFNALHIQGPPSATLEFSEEAWQRGAYNTNWGWGVQFVDVENDADLDIFAVNGFDDLVEPHIPCGIYQTPSVLLENDGTAHFNAVMPAELANLPDDSRGLVAFDYDRDGDQDFLVTNYEAPTRLLRNDTPAPGHWLGARARQVRGNERGIGVRVDVRSSAGLTQRQVILAGESFLVGTPPEVHFGLAGVTQVEYVRAHWEDGTATTWTDVAADQFLELVQPEHLCDRDASPAINLADATAFLFDWLAEDWTADLNGDEAFDAADLQLFADCWFEHARDLQPGTNYCTSLPNSISSSGAHLGAYGSASMTANDLTLAAGPIPAGEPGLMFHGTTKVQVPFGDGLRCAAGSTVQLWPPAKADALGIVTKSVDYGTASVAPGWTRHFQCWYRDPNGGPADFNLTEGLSIKFLP